MKKLAFTSASHIPVDKERSIFFLPSTKVEEERVSLFFFLFWFFLLFVCACSKANKSLSKLFQITLFPGRTFSAFCWLKGIVIHAIKGEKICW